MFDKGLFEGVPRGIPKRRREEFAAPGACFFDPDTLDSSYAWTPGKVFLGVIDGAARTDANGRPYVTGGRSIGVEDDRHICTIAGNRAGKGRAAIVTNLLHYPGSMGPVIDPKTELASITARRRKQMGQSVHVLKAFGKPPSHLAEMIAGFNPVEAMRDGQLVEDAALIGDALVISSDKDPHFDESARTFIEGVLLHVRTDDAFNGRRNLFTLRQLVGGNAANLDLLRLDMEKNKAAGGVVQAAAADFFDRPDRERGGVLSTARRNLKFIDLFNETGPGKRTLQSHDFNLSDLKTRPTTIYLCLPARHMGTCNRWLRLFVNLTLQSMEQTRRRTLPGGVPVVGVFDEFATLGTLKQVEVAAGAIAGEGFRMWIVLQDLGQLRAMYAERWETFLGNSGIVQLFGNTDVTTLEWMAKRCGRTSIRVPQSKPRTVGQIDQGDKDGWTTEVYDLLGVDEAARLFGREDPQCRQLVFVGGLQPMILQRAYYDKHALFAGRFDGVPLVDEGNGS